jgi:hypothetical protein
MRLAIQGENDFSLTYEVDTNVLLKVIGVIVSDMGNKLINVPITEKKLEMQKFEYKKRDKNFPNILKTLVLNGNFGGEFSARDIFEKLSHKLFIGKRNRTFYDRILSVLNKIEKDKELVIYDRIGKTKMKKIIFRLKNYNEIEIQKKQEQKNSENDDGSNIGNNFPFTDLSVENVESFLKKQIPRGKMSYKDACEFFGYNATHRPQLSWYGLLTALADHCKKNKLCTKVTIDQTMAGLEFKR